MQAAAAAAAACAAAAAHVSTQSQHHAPTSRCISPLNSPLASLPPHHHSTRHTATQQTTPPLNNSQHAMPHHHLSRLNKHQLPPNNPYHPTPTATRHRLAEPSARHTSHTWGGGREGDEAGAFVMSCRTGCRVASEHACTTCQSVFFFVSR
jgi:hypothetical protein